MNFDEFWWIEQWIQTDGQTLEFIWRGRCDLRIKNVTFHTKSDEFHATNLQRLPPLESDGDLLPRLRVVLLHACAYIRIWVGGVRFDLSFSFFFLLFPSFSFFSPSFSVISPFVYAHCRWKLVGRAAPSSQCDFPLIFTVLRLFLRLFFGCFAADLGLFWCFLRRIWVYFDD